MEKITTNIVLFITIIALAGCGGGGGGGDDGGSIEVREVTLSVSAPTDFTVDEGETVNLTANGRATGGSAALKYTWTYIGINPDITLANANSRTANFIAPQVDSDRTFYFQIELSAEGFIPSDFTTGLPRDTVAVTVRDTTPRPPVASAGSDQTVPSGSDVNLNGSASTDDRGIDAYAWTQIGGQAVTLSNASTQNAILVAPVVSASSELQFELSVTDGGDLTSTDTVSITVEPPEPPVAIALNASQKVFEGDQVTLDGRPSTDDLAIASYEWTQTSGPSVSIVNSSAAITSFIAPATEDDITLEFSLTVRDETDLSGSEDVIVTVSPINELPQASVAFPATIDEQTLVNMDASASSDPDGQIASHQWSQLAGPAVILSGENTAHASFISPTLTSEAILVFRLAVTDNEGGTDEDDISITVQPVNLPPTLSISSPPTALSREEVSVEIAASDSDGSIHSVNVVQTSGAKIELRGGVYSKHFTAPLVDSYETFSFDVTITDNEGASATDTVSVAIQRPDMLTEIFFPIDGSLYEGKQISVQGRTTEKGSGVLADLTVTTNGGSFTTTSDSNGYWRIDDVKLNENFDSHTITVDANHDSGETSNASITLEAKQVSLSGSRAIAERCGNDQLFVLLSQAVVEMNCDGTDRKIIASSDVGSGEPMPHAGFMEFTFTGPQSGGQLILDSANGLISLSPVTKERTVVYPRNGDPAVDVRLLALGDNFSRQAFIKDSSASTDLESFLAIDLETGASEVLTAFTQTLIDQGVINSIAAIESNGSGSRLYVSTYRGRVLLVDVVSGEFEEIADGSAFGTFISDIAYYSDAQTYLFDSNTSAIYHLPHVSFPEKEITVDGFETFLGYRDAEVDYQGVYALARNRSNTLMNLSINSEGNLNQTSILTEDTGINAYDFGMLKASTYDPNTGRIFISGDTAIYSIDLNTGNANEFIDYNSLDFRFGRQQLLYDPANDYLFVNDNKSGTSKIALLDGLTASILQPPVELSLDSTNPYTTEMKLDNRVSGGVYLKTSSTTGSDGDSVRRVTAPFSLDSEGKVITTPLPAIDPNHLPLRAIAGTVTSNTLYGVKRTEQSLISIDPDSGTSALALDFDGLFGDSIYPDTLDWSEESSMLYLSSSGSPRAIFSLDPATQTLVHISSSQHGRGPRFQTAQHLHVDYERRIIIVTEIDGLFVVDMDSGDRVLIYTN